MLCPPKIITVSEAFVDGMVFDALIFVLTHVAATLQLPTATFDVNVIDFIEKQKINAKKVINSFMLIIFMIVKII
jgi:hypothetical protein